MTTSSSNLVANLHPEIQQHIVNASFLEALQFRFVLEEKYQRLLDLPGQTKVLILAQQHDKT
jgi:ADP-heptose:LPS heptosyltransferase